MAKVTYPRESPTCGKEFSKGYFFHHKKHCGTTEHRYHCPLCPLSFSQYGNMQHHVRQQHSNNPLRFVCSMCGTELTTAHKMRLHMATVCAEQKLRYNCWYCNAAFTRKDNRQTHMRCIHGPICREKKDNLQLYLQHLSEEQDFQDEWMFLESRPIKRGEHNVCPCSQTPIQSYFFMENKINGNRTFVGSTCIGNIDPKAGAVIAYFKNILEQAVEGIYRGQNENGLQKFAIKSTTRMVCRLHDVEQLNPPVTRNLKGEWQVLVKHPKPVTLVENQVYWLRLKAKYVRGQLTFTAL